MTRRTSVVDRRALAAALTRRGRPLLEDAARSALADDLDALAQHFLDSTRGDLRGSRRQAAQYAETIAALVDKLDAVITRRTQALTRRAGRRATAIGVSPETAYTVTTRSWQRTIATWRRLTAAETARWQRPVGRTPDGAWRCAAADVCDLLTEAGVPITAAETGAYVRVLRVLADAVGRDGDVRATARAILADAEQGEK